MAQQFGRVYKIINDINDKVYVGETTRNLDDRFSEHCFDKRSTTKIHKAIEQLGWTHFKIVELEKVPIENLYEREKYWVEYYNSFYNGYNGTPDGQYGNVHLRNYSSILVIEPNIIFDSKNIMAREISELTSWSRRFCVEKINKAIDTNTKFLDYSLKVIEVPIEQVSSIEDRENWIKNLNIQYLGKRVYCVELDKEFDTISNAARYLLENQYYITDSKYPVQTIITLISNNLKRKNTGINTTIGLLTFEKLPGTTKVVSPYTDHPYHKSKTKCVELNLIFDSQKEAAQFMIDNGYWKKIKLKTAILRVSDVINGVVPKYKGYSFESI